MFVDPATEDPEKHIGFRDEILFPRTERGEVTINALDLNRERLREHRATQFNALRRESDALRVLASAPLGYEFPDSFVAKLIHEIESAITERCRDDAEYAAMTRAFVGR